MAPTKIEVLLSELCVDLGFCLPPQAIVYFREHPPLDIDAFATAVFEAAGVDVGGSRHLWRQVRERVAAHFHRWEEDDELSLDRDAPYGKKA